MKHILAATIVLAFGFTAAACKTSGGQSQLAEAEVQSSPLSGQYLLESATVTKSLADLDKGPDTSSPHRLLVKVDASGEVHLTFQSQYKNFATLDEKGMLGKPDVEKYSYSSKSSDGLSLPEPRVKRITRRFDMTGAGKDVLRFYETQEDGNQFFGKWETYKITTLFAWLKDGKLMVSLAIKDPGMPLDDVELTAQFVRE